MERVARGEELGPAVHPLIFLFAFVVAALLGYAGALVWYLFSP